ncbi:MAG: SurA N-terminal domain-containing protein [Bacteroidaceae bacterium]|nr:SurA N-terminal domain-containing protein [Bacteroidaceae bacterium]MBQ9642375.1 SurA N-terminal domain-containing protein [Bacteroidaceae bacterium]
MAALQSIRNRGVLLVSAIAVALFLFVVGDALRGGESFFNQSKMNVGEVDGEKVSIQDYQQMVEDFTTFYEIQQNKSGLTEDENNRIKDEAWQTFIQNQLIGSECKKLGLAVTDEEVSEVIKSGYSQMLQVPVFMNQQTGRYDYASVQTFLTEYKKAKDAGQQLPDAYQKIYKYYIFAQKQIRNQLLVQKYQSLLSACFLSNPVEAKAAFEGRASESDVLLAAVPFTTVDDKAVEVSEADIKAKYDKDKEQYRQYVETRDAKILDIQVQPSTADKAAAEKDMDEVYGKLVEAQTAEAAGNVVRQATSIMPYTNILKTKDAFPPLLSARIDSLAVGTTTKPVFDAAQNVYYTLKMIDKATKPDSVLFRQIGVVAKNEADVEKRADSIMTALASGANFKAIAKKYNQVGDSSWLSSSQYQNAQLDGDNALFVTTLSDMAAGQTKKLKLDGGTIILQVLETRNPVQKYNMAAVVKELKFSDDTYSAEYNKFSSFIAANPTLEQIEANAQKNGYVVRPLNDLTSNGHNIAGIRNTRDAVKWLFDDAKEGQVSQLYECGNNDHLMILALTGVNKEGYRAISKVNEIITEQVKAEKKGEKLMADLSGVNSWAKAKATKGAICDTLRHINFTSPSFIAATNASEPVVSALASKTAAGAFAGPVKGNSGVYMLQVINKSKSAEKFDAKQEQQSLASQNYRRVANSVMQTLYLNAKVKDQRYKFF